MYEDKNFRLIGKIFVQLTSVSKVFEILFEFKLFKIQRKILLKIKKKCPTFDQKIRHFLIYESLKFLEFLQVQNPAQNRC
jgi:hypothetical protein